jgi:hypothetical protein
VNEGVGDSLHPLSALELVQVVRVRDLPQRALGRLRRPPYAAGLVCGRASWSWLKKQWDWESIKAMRHDTVGQVRDAGTNIDMKSEFLARMGRRTRRRRRRAPLAVAVALGLVLRAAKF